MFENIKNEFGLPQKNEWRESAAGIVILLIFVLLSYSVGRSDGRDAEREEVPQNAKIEAQLDRVEKAMMSNRECGRVLIESQKP